MDLDDEVVEEFDVVVNPGDVGKLNLLQYPFRPRYRPYGDQGTLSHANISEDGISLVYSMDTNSKNYNKNSSDFTCTEHVLTSKKVSPLNNYYIGVFNEGKFHLTHIHDIFQMKPSLDYINKSYKTIPTGEDGSTQAAKMKVYRKTIIKVEDTVKEEPVRVECNGTRSEESNELVKRLTQNCDFTAMYEGNDSFSQFLQRPDEPRGLLQSLRAQPVQIQVERILTKVQVINTDFLIDCLGDVEYTALGSILCEMATVIQGRWVCKSELFPVDPHARNLVLALLWKNECIDHELLITATQDYPEYLRILKQIGIKENNVWKLNGYSEEDLYRNSEYNEVSKKYWTPKLRNLSKSHPNLVRK